MTARTVLCGALYTAGVDASRMVFWDRSLGNLIMVAPVPGKYQELP